MEGQKMTTLYTEEKRLLDSKDGEIVLHFRPDNPLNINISWTFAICQASIEGQNVHNLCPNKAFLLEDKLTINPKCNAK